MNKKILAGLVSLGIVVATYCALYFYPTGHVYGATESGTPKGIIVIIGAVLLGLFLIIFNYLHRSKTFGAIYNPTPTTGTWSGSLTGNILQAVAALGGLAILGTTVVNGNLVVSGGYTGYTTTSTVTANAFCVGNVVVANTTGSITLTLPTLASVQSSTPGTGGCGPLTAGAYSDQYFLNNSTNSVTILTNTGITLFSASSTSYTTSSIAAGSALQIRGVVVNTTTLWALQQPFR